ncbi:hypothetical protein OQA88_3284 [Cercophora sp. LCS_1]
MATHGDILRPLHPTVLLARHGDRLKELILKTVGMFVVIHQTGSSTLLDAPCRALHCFHEKNDNGRTHTEDPAFVRVRRVPVDATLTQDQLFHAICFSAMMDVGSLIGEQKVQFDYGLLYWRPIPTWGLFPRMWYAYKGHVDLDQLAKDMTDRTNRHKRHFNTTPMPFTLYDVVKHPLFMAEPTMTAEQFRLWSPDFLLTKEEDEHLTQYPRPALYPTLSTGERVTFREFWDKMRENV